MDIPQVVAFIKKKLPHLQVLSHVPLAPYTSLKIGGPADIFILSTSQDQFVSIVKLIHQFSSPAGQFDNFLANITKPSNDQSSLETSSSPMPITILGGGSNVLISDSGITGIVVKNESSQIDLTSTPTINVSSGTPLSYLINYTLDHQLLGLEEFAYIPGTVGGAIYGNIHGVRQNNFSQFLDTITIFDLLTGNTKTLKSTDLHWDYDTSEFQTHPQFIILSSTFILKQDDPTAAKLFVQDTIRSKSQIQATNSNGSVFKNPSPFETQKIWGESKTAGWIIDQLDWKGKTFGGAQVSPTHANFIVNFQNSTASDFYHLMTQIQSDVLQKTGIHLVPEIKLLGNFS